jgi:hypothetical protein
VGRVRLVGMVYITHCFDLSKHGKPCEERRQALLHTASRVVSGIKLLKDTLTSPYAHTPILEAERWGRTRWMLNTAEHVVRGIL